MPGKWKLPKPLRRLSPEAQDSISICGRSSDLFPNIRPARFYPVVFRMLHNETYSYGDSSGLSPDSLFIRPRFFHAVPTRLLPVLRNRYRMQRYGGDTASKRMPSKNYEEVFNRQETSEYPEQQSDKIYQSVNSRGVEPLSSEPESEILSIELRVRVPPKAVSGAKVRKRLQIHAIFADNTTKTIQEWTLRTKRTSDTP